MLDRRFYNALRPITINDILNLGLDIEYVGNKEDKCIISGVETLDKASDGDISFFHNVKYENKLRNTKASFVVLRKEYIDICPCNVAKIISKNPLLDFASIIDFMVQENEFKPYISNLSYISENAIVDSNVQIGNFSTIGSGVKIGSFVKIGDNVSIGDGVEIGSNTVIGSNVTISHAIVGKNVIINSGARIGESGFGIVPAKDGLHYIKQIGRVVLSDFVRVGANTTIDRGSIEDTFIGTGTIIDNLVQIGHNVRVGNYSVIVAQVGISGSAEVGNGTTLAGQVGIAGHIKIGDNVIVAAKGGVTNNIPNNSVFAGFPASDIKEWRKKVALLNIMLKNKNKFKTSNI